jgi:hypothetical protein
MPRPVDGPAEDHVTAQVALWDFGDTIADERWMLNVPEGYDGWVAGWRGVLDELATEWYCGRINSETIFSAVAARTGMPVPAVDAHARACCRKVVFHTGAWRAAREHRVPQALVTVNSDLFRDEVIPAYGLGDVFDVIVNSFEEGSRQKADLCEIAVQRLGFDGDRKGALLIDNRLDAVEAWRGAGGSAYWYQNDRDRDLADDLEQFLPVPEPGSRPR